MTALNFKNTSYLRKFNSFPTAGINPGCFSANYSLTFILAILALGILILIYLSVPARTNLETNRSRQAINTQKLRQTTTFQSPFGATYNLFCF